MKRKSEVQLSPEAIRAIEDILMDGSTAEIRVLDEQVSVTRVYRKRVFPN